MTTDVLGRLSRRAIGERPNAAPQDDGIPTKVPAPAAIDTEEQQAEPVAQPQVGRPPVEPAAAPVTPPAKRHETTKRENGSVTPAAAAELPQSDIKPAARIEEHRPEPGSKQAPYTASASERRNKSTPVAPRAESTFDIAHIATRDPEADTAEREFATPPPEFRPRAEKTLAIETRNDTASRRDAIDTSKDESEETVVNVHIGRIEVRAPQTPQAVSRPQPQRAKSSSPSLASYLAARSRSRG